MSSLRRALREGHPAGGPLFFLGAAAALLLAGCGGGPGPARPAPGEAGVPARPLEIYRDLGLLAGPETFPVVASFSTLAGPADSTYVIFGLSLPNQALRFQRETQGFRAEYTVSLVFRRDTVPVRQVESRETVRVSSFGDTERSEESVVFQNIVALPPGEYAVDLEARDGNSARAFRATDTLSVPAYGPGRATFSGPLPVYRASGRRSVSEPPDIIINPRRSVEYGEQPYRLYLELYDTTEAPIELRVRDEDGNDIWTARRTLDLGAEGLHYLILDVPSDTLPLGRLSIVALPEGHPADSTTALVTVSDQWVVANFDELLQFVSYIASEAELDSLRNAQGPERQRLWDRFWDRRDPLPATPANEFRETFFERVRTAAQEFREPGTPGWRSDRGEVYIVLGTPTNAVDLAVDQRDVGGRGAAIQWTYESAPGGRLTLVFVDQAGFGRYELTPGSRSAFRSAAERLRPRD